MLPLHSRFDSRMNEPVILVSLPSSVGIVPSNEFMPKNNWLRIRMRLPSCVGMAELNRFWPKPIYLIGLGKILIILGEILKKILTQSVEPNMYS